MSAALRDERHRWLIEDGTGPTARRSEKMLRMGGLLEVRWHDAGPVWIRFCRARGCR